MTQPSLFSQDRRGREVPTVERVVEHPRGAMPAGTGLIPPPGGPSSTAHSTETRAAEAGAGQPDAGEAAARTRDPGASRSAPASTAREEQAAQLARVSSRIGAAIVAFLRERLASGRVQFRAEDLRQAVAAAGAPGSCDRVMRDLRARNAIGYVVTDRASSLYRLEWVAPWA